jgi:predicted lactoylglutathione lyase
VTHETAAWELAEQTAVAMLVGGVSAAGPDVAAIATAAGPLLQAALGTIVGSIRGTRTGHAAEALLDAAQEAGVTSADAFAEFIEDAVSDERSQELLARALSVAQDTASRAKRRAAGRSIAAGIADKDTKVDEELIFLRVLDDLDAPHFRLLHLMSAETPPHHGDPGRPQFAVPTGWMQWDLTEADPGLGDTAPALLSGLQRHGLVSTGELRTPGGTQEPIYTLTNYGHRLLSRLADPP